MASEIEGQKKLFGQQEEKILVLLEKAPKTEVFVQEVDEGNFPHREVSETLDIFNVPSPVANWLPQLWNNRYLEDGKTVRDMTQEDLETEQADLVKIAGLTKGGEISYSSLEELDEKKKGTVDNAIEQLIEEYGRTGILYGVKITERSYNREDYEVAKIDFDGVRKILQEKLEKQAEELRMKARKLAG